MYESATARGLRGSSPLTRGKQAQGVLRGQADGLIPAHAGKTLIGETAAVIDTAHPRSRGENEMDRATARIPAGSSPLTRGKRRGSRSGPRPARLIPAHAGKTSSLSAPRQSTAAHPRSRGENRFTLKTLSLYVGSSPLTRGKQDPSPRRARRPGLIPAHAGKTYRYRQTKQGSGAHPRSRGENRPVCEATRPACGSSPLTRGKRHEGLVHPDPRGLIPAHAGKTPGSPRRPGRPWAHPRSRGENKYGTRVGMAWRGSSPLTRGKRHPRADWIPTHRLIPAHAGKTRCPSRRVRLGAAHPRSRGENSDHGLAGGEDAGSSPLTRGKRPAQQPRNALRGLIPAHAGKTRLRRPTPAWTRAHPRSRGENQNGEETTPPRKGSSPLTRGKRAGSRTRANGWRAHPRSRGENDICLSMGTEGRGSSPLTRGKRRPCWARRPRPGLIPAHAGKTRRSTVSHSTPRAHPRSRGENHGIDPARD